MKKMNLFSKILLMLAVSGAMSGIAQAGPTSGGGGASFVCKNSSGAIERSILLDLWEASNIYGWSIAKNDTPWRTQFKAALTKLRRIDPSLAALTENAFDKIQPTAVFLDQTVSFEPPDDAKAKFTDPNCVLSGMLYFDDKMEKLYISKPVFEKLETATDEAAAWFHESVYKVVRTRLGQADSVATRIIVGCVFSQDEQCLRNSDLEQIFAGYSDVKYCQSDALDYYLGTKTRIGGSKESLIALKRMFNYDLSQNYVVSAQNDETVRPTLTDILGLYWTVQDWAGGGSFPFPAGIYVTNTLTREQISGNQGTCVQVNLRN